MCPFQEPYAQERGKYLLEATPSHPHDLVPNQLVVGLVWALALGAHLANPLC